MKRLPILFLVISLLVGVVPSAAAVETDVASLFPAIRTCKGFSDVGKDAWYADYAKLCYETGLMEGKEGGSFDPEAAVTVAEAATVVARFHDLLHGGDGLLPAVPQNPDMVSFLAENGQNAVSFAEAEDWTSGAGVLYLRFSEVGLSSLRQREAPVDKLTLVINGGLTGEGQQFQGEYRLITGGTILDDDPWEGYVFDVPANTDPDPYAQLIAIDLLEESFADLSTKWYRNTQWYFYLNYDVFQEIEAFPLSERTASRSEFLSLLSAVVPRQLLAAKNSITALPDTQDEDVLAFYNAGILTGIDQYGTFAADHSLTRAELAAMLVRILRPALRLSFSPKRLAIPYTLTPMALSIDKDMVKHVVSVSGDGAFLSVSGENGLLSLWDWTGHQLTQPLYTFMNRFGSDGVAAVCRDGLYGYLDLTGREVVPCTYKYVALYHDGILLAGDSQNEWSVFDASGQIRGTLPADVNFMTTLGGYIQYHDSATGKYGYLHPDGSIAIPAKYDNVYPFSEGYFGVGSGYYKGFIDLEGNVAVPLEYAYIFSGFSEGMAIVGTFGSTPNPLHYDGKYGAVNTKGTVVIPFLYDYLGCFSDGLAPFVRKEDAGNYIAGYVALDGTERITSTGSYAVPASYACGYACSLDNSTGKYGYADIEGNMVISSIFTSVTDLVDGGCVVEIGDELLLLTLN